MGSFFSSSGDDANSQNNSQQSKHQYSLSAISQVAMQNLPFSVNSTCFSPFSLMHALLVLIKCSSDASIQELTQKLQLKEADMQQQVNQIVQDQKVAVASDLFSKQIDKINPDFSEKMMKELGFVPEKLVSVDQVNKWCARMTHDRIPKIIDDINFDTIILSAIYFKADWQDKFNVHETYDDYFTGFDKKADQKVRMMYMLKYMDYAENRYAQMVKLHCLDSDVEAIIILPKGKSKSDFMKALNEKCLNTEFVSYNRVRLRLPKFSFEDKIDMNEMLKAAGICKIFENIDCKATLGFNNAKVQDITQKTFIKVDEQGTEAAAITEVRILCGSAFGFKPKLEVIKNVICDRPFWFVLARPRMEILFIASYLGK